MGSDRLTGPAAEFLESIDRYPQPKVEQVVASRAALRTNTLMISGTSQV